MNVNENQCIQHEEQIQELARKTAELEAHANFKEQRISELIEDNKRIEGKIDNLTDTVNKVMLNSIRDDNDLKQRVLTLETKSDTQEKVLKEYEETQRKQREEDRAKTTQYMAAIGTVIGVLSFIFAYILK
jgi:chromosome segregation ATPase